MAREPETGDGCARHSASRSTGRLPLLVVSAAFASMLLSANLATPLYAGYSARFGFSSAVLALIFATAALVLIPSLLVFGQVSDGFGRRRVIGAGLALAIVALILFTLAEGVGWLFAARAIQRPRGGIDLARACGARGSGCGCPAGQRENG